MSRKTKQKSTSYGVLPNGQIVRRDTLEGWTDDQRADARGYSHAEVEFGELDLDHTRAHREELKERSRRATENARRAGLVK
mgnify:FL=1